MKTAVFYWVDRPQQLGWRIANFIANTLDVRFYANTGSQIHKELNLAKEEIKVDTFIYVNGLEAFADPQWRAEMARIVVQAEHFVFVQNDYAMRPPLAFREAYAKAGRPWQPIMWSTIPDKVHRSEQWLEHKRGAYINWNMIGYRYMDLTKPKTRRPGLFYYGDLRQRRSQYLLDYCGDHVSYPVTISAPEVSHTDYRKLLGEQATLLPPMLSLYDDLQKWETALYIEDDYSHTHRTSPATRFYECLSAGVAQLFDWHATSTLLDEYDVLPYTVRNAEDVKHSLKYAKDIAERQQREFVLTPRTFQTRLQNAVLKAYSAL